MKVAQLEHRFVRNVPDQIEPGILYISMDYATAVHSCCCGCGEEIVTPFTPTDWRMTFDGETVSLRPSIGNWNLKCRSHYFVERGRIVVAGSWTQAQIAAERRRDKAAKAAYYGTTASGAPAEPAHKAQRAGIWTTVKRWAGWG